jgi:N-acetylglucosaminyldiphosphoundecaprenol N-acetyl-beta-D-mannosaminyltransferase
MATQVIDEEICKINSALCRTGYILGLPITLDSGSTVLECIAEKIERRDSRHFISITNTESMYHGLRNKSHGDYIRNADLSLCDGVGVIVAGWFWGIKVPRFNGPILQLECSRLGVAKRWKHFFYGGKPGVAAEMARRLKEKYPGLDVCGIYEPPFRNLTPEEDAVVVAQINASGADFVWVGLGLLKQERWIAEHRDRIHATWMISVGAAFDYHSGAVRWAPAPLRAIGLEWLFRLILQPKLRARRYWWSLVYVLQATVAGIASLRFLAPEVSTRARRGSATVASVNKGHA